MDPHWATYFELVPRWSLTPKPINSASKQAAQDAINASETVCSTIAQSFWISQVLLSCTDLLKRVMTGIPNPIAIGTAQLNQTNTVICQLSSFFRNITQWLQRESLSSAAPSFWAEKDKNKEKHNYRKLRSSSQVVHIKPQIKYTLRVLIPKKLSVP